MKGIIVLCKHHYLTNEDDFFLFFLFFFKITMLLLAASFRPIFLLGSKHSFIFLMGGYLGGHPFLPWPRPNHFKIKGNSEEECCNWAYFHLQSWALQWEDREIFSSPAGVFFFCSAFRLMFSMPLRLKSTMPLMMISARITSNLFRDRDN